MIVDQKRDLFFVPLTKIITRPEKNLAQLEINKGRVITNLPYLDEFEYSND